jgi:hypothetical protein
VAGCCAQEGSGVMPEKGAQRLIAERGPLGEELADGVGPVLEVGEVGSEDEPGGPEFGGDLAEHGFVGLERDPALSPKVLGRRPAHASPHLGAKLRVLDAVEPPEPVR